MNKKRLIIILLLISAVIFLFALNSWIQKKPIISSPQASGIKTGRESNPRIKDYFASIVRFKLELIKISENRSEILSTDEIFTQNNKKAEISYSFSWGKQEIQRSLQIQLVPRIRKMKKVEFLYFSFIHTGDEPRPLGGGDKLMLKSGTSILKNLFIHQELSQKIAVKITPYIQDSFVLGDYPFDEVKLNLHNWLLIVNKDQMYYGGSVQVPYPEKYLFLYIYLKKYGLFLIGFRQFPGSEPMGMIEGNKILLFHDKDVIECYSEAPIISQTGKWKLWLRHNQNFDALKSYFTNVLADESKKSIDSSIGVISGKNAYVPFFYNQ